MGSSGHSYLIVGAGVFGASTALHLRESDPSAHITLVDRTPFPCPYAASHDLNKIVRADYGDIFYSKLALEAQQGWKDDAVYAPFYHESGLLNVENTGLGRKMIQNYKDLGIDFAAEIISPEDARSRFDGLFQHADWTDVKEVFWNPRSGWAQATDALRKVIEVAVERGVSYAEATVSTLLFDEEGACIGVEATDGQRITADQVILCTGAQTPRLLADSAPHRKELQADGRLIAAGVVTAYVQLTPEQIERYRDVPVLVNGMSQTLGETMPPTPDGLLKFCRDVSFTNNVQHQASGQTFSVPPPGDDQNTWTEDVQQGLKDEVSDVMMQIYGKDAETFEFKSFRICWDSITPNQDWIISPHPKCRNLYIATAGSFHGWKFLPNVGRYVAQMLQGTLDDEKSRRWGWDRENHGAAHGKLLPRRDIKDIRGKSE